MAEAQDFSMMNNFDILKTNLKIDVAKFLGRILELWYSDIEGLKSNETFEKLENKSKQEIARRGNFALSIPVLCDVLLKETSRNLDCGSKHFHGDITRLKDIWTIHIVDNDDEMIPLSCMEALQKELKEIIDRMVTRYDNIEHWCVPNIQRTQQGEKLQRQTSAQYGDWNTMDINLGRRTESLVFMKQVGDKNKMIIQLEDRRQTEYIELKSSGKVKLRMVLKSNQTEAWKKIEDNFLKIDLEELNSNPVLRENDFVVDNIEKGSVVVSLNTSNGIQIKDCLRNLFNVLYEVLDIESILQKCNASEIRVHGYIYCPEEFKEGPNRKTSQDLVIIRHYSWTTTTTKCDIDVYVSKLMRSLIHADFSTDVDERIEVEIKCGFSSYRALHQITPNEERDKLFCDELRTASLELQKMKKTGNSVHLSLKCIGKIRYSHIFDISGPIDKITKTLFGSVSDTALRLSVFTDTHFVNDSVANPGLVFYLNPLSKILDSADEDRFSHIITAMLQGKNTSLLRNVGEIKVKAILEYHEEKGLHIERQKQFDMKYQQMKSRANSQENDNPELVNDIFKAYEVKKPYLVIQLLEKGVNPNVRNEKLQTPLHLASENKLERVVEKLISHDAEINVVDEKQETPLFVAARCGHEKIITSLLTHGADPEISNSNQHTPLYIAAKNGHHFAMLQLLKFDANVNSASDNHQTPLHIACQNENYAVVKVLLAYGADVHYMDKDQNTPLHSTLLEMDEKFFDTGIVDELIRRGSIVNKKNGNSKTPLSIAAKNGLVSVTRNLLEAGADINLTDNENNLPLHMACQNGHVEIVQELLKKSNDIDRCNAKEQTPRMLAKKEDLKHLFDSVDVRHEYNENLAFKFAKQGNTDELLTYSKQKKYLEAKDSCGRSLLYVASRNGHMDIVRMLIESNVNINECDFVNRSPLSVAAEHKFDCIVELLIHSGADANITDNFGRTALHYGVKSGSPQISSIIIQHGHLAYKQDNEGKTPLHFCAIYGNFAAANILLAKREIDVNELDFKSLTPLNDAIQYGHLDVAELLLKHQAKTSCRDSNERTPLHLAAEIGNNMAIDMLLRFGGEINQCDAYLQTPLYVAAKNGRSVLLNIIKHGADINIPDVSGRTPLYVSLEKNFVFATKVLVKHGSNVHLADQEGITPLHLASRLGNSEVVSLLIKAKADINAADAKGCTSLHYCTSGTVSILLIQNGGSVNYTNMNGMTPLHTTVEILCQEDIDSNKTSEYLFIMNELLQFDANICICDNNMETVIHKSVYASNYHLLVELLSIKLSPDIRGTVANIVNDCLKISKNKQVTETLKHWITIHMPATDLQLADNVTISELCPTNMYKEHEEWLRKHKLLKRANILRREMSIEKGENKDTNAA